MSYEFYELMRNVYGRVGPQKFGTLCQGLLVLTLRRCGYRARGQQVGRPDIFASKERTGYQIEVKAMENGQVTINEEDIEGVKDFDTCGIKPVIAVLTLDPRMRWVMAKAGSIRPGLYSRRVLEAFALERLSDEVNAAFPSSVTAARQLLESGAVTELWKTYGIEHSRTAQRTGTGS